ncbi:unnamed protein product [Macrosiphum euphorbiae]|uniref:Uncharacterized protein n=1 Tax=Macrosiphum euphorbiae TaxID=13131 RepID=A0AAV0WH31_9HEMI|nr:unnamed protein product [Macrosiphum euphorbiae]
MTLQLNTPESRESFRKARNIHNSNVRKAKKLIWHTFAEDPIITGNAWGKLTKWLIKGKRYQLIPPVLRKRDGTFTTSTGDTVRYMLDELIPTSAQGPKIESVHLMGPTSPQITNEELTLVVKKQRNSAPEADGLSARII